MVFPSYKFVLKKIIKTGLEYDYDLTILASQMSEKIRIGKTRKMRKTRKISLFFLFFISHSFFLLPLQRRYIEPP